MAQTIAPTIAQTMAQTMRSDEAQTKRSTDDSGSGWPGHYAAGRSVWNCQDLTALVNSLAALRQTMTAADYPQAVTQPEIMNARFGPGLAYDVITTLPQGTRANIIGVDPPRRMVPARTQRHRNPRLDLPEPGQRRRFARQRLPGFRRGTRPAPDFRRPGQQTGGRHPAGGHERPPWSRT